MTLLALAPAALALALFAATLRLRPPRGGTQTRALTIGKS
jgi:hypothetical protein